MVAGTFVPLGGIFVHWNFRFLTLIIKPILYTIFDALASMVPLSFVCRPSVHLSIRNGCIVDKRWILGENFLHG